MRNGSRVFNRGNYRSRRHHAKQPVLTELARDAASARFIFTGIFDMNRRRCTSSIATGCRFLYEKMRAAEKEDWDIGGSCARSLCGPRKIGAQMTEMIVWGYKEGSKARRYGFSCSASFCGPFASTAVRAAIASGQQK